jgi:hypothetical protein
MAIEKEGCKYIPVVQVRIDYRTATCSLLAAKMFAKGDVVTVLPVYEAKKKEEKVLIFEEQDVQNREMLRLRKVESHSML